MPLPRKRESLLWLYGGGLSPLRKGDSSGFAFAGMTKYTSSKVEQVPHFPRSAT